MNAQQIQLPDWLWMLDKVIALPLQSIPSPFNLEDRLMEIGLQSVCPDNLLLDQLEAMSRDFWLESPLLENQLVRKRIELLAFNLHEAKRLYIHQLNNRVHKYDFGH